MKSKQQVVSEFRRAEIVAAARTVFARKGFSQGVMDEIARQAGIAKGTVYLYFKSKAELYREVLHHDMKILSSGTLARMDAAASLREKICAFTLTRLENADARKNFFRIMDADQGHLSISRKQYRDWLREPVLRMAAAIRQAAENGEIRPLDPEKAAWLIADMTRGTVQRRLLGLNNAPASTDAEFLVGFIWAALAAAPAPAPSSSGKTRVNR